MASQCKGCENRHIGCHSECEAYLTWKEHITEQHRKERLERIRQKDGFETDHFREGWMFRRKKG